MRKFVLLLSAFFLFFFARPFVSNVSAAGEPFTCGASVSPKANLTYSSNKATFGSDLGPGDNFTISFTVSGNNASQIQNPVILVCDEDANSIFNCGEGEFVSRVPTRNGNTFTITVPASTLASKKNGDWTAVLRGNLPGRSVADMCPLVDSLFSSRDISDTAVVDCSQLSISPQPITAGTTQITLSYQSNSIQDDGEYLLNLWAGGITAHWSSPFRRNQGVVSHTYNINPASLPDNASVALDRRTGPNNQQAVCTIPLDYNPETGEVEVGAPIEEELENESVPVQNFSYCAQAPAGPQRDACIACVGETDTEGQDKIYTAFGCMRVSGAGLTEDLVRLLLGIVGGIALLSILAAAFLLTTSQGEVSKVKQAKELITASVSGILFIIFSIMALNFIGVTVLRIPGLM